MQGVGDLYCLGSDDLDLQHQENYVCMDNHSPHKEVHESLNISRHIVKQRSEQLHSVRSSGHVTGSSANRAVGLKSLKEQIAYFDEKFNQKTPKERTDLQKKMIAHGTANEIHAMTTLIGKVLPAYYSNLRYIEEDFYVMKNAEQQFLVVSPDRTGRGGPNGKAHLAFKFKCPYPEKQYVPTVHYKVPDYYVVQLLCEMAALQCQTMLFISYSLESSTISKVTYSKTLFEHIWQELLAVGSAVAKFGKVGWLVVWV